MSETMKSLLSNESGPTEYFFKLKVLSVTSIPADFEGKRLAIHWRRLDRFMSTKPQTMHKGTVLWNQELNLSTTVEYDTSIGKYQEKLTEL